MVTIYIYQFQPGAPWSTPLRWKSSSGNGRPIRSWSIPLRPVGTAFWIRKLRPGNPTGAGNLIRRVGKLAAHYYRRIAGACIASDTKPAFLGRCTGLAGC